MDSNFTIRELFHLRLLRALSERLQGRAWALKGGVCLRLYHGSPRLSEDMDLDLDPGMPVATAEKGIDAALASRPLLSALAPSGVSGLKISKPKQSSTTQRWKINLLFQGGAQLPTKLEISRRHKVSGQSSGVPSQELLASHQLVPFPAPYYGAAAMTAQKLAALASPSRTALRDLFDLNLLLARSAESRASLGRAEDPLRRDAVKKIRGFTRRDFQAQVAPYLPEELAILHGSAQGFESLRHGTLAYLEPLNP